MLCRFVFLLCLSVPAVGTPCFEAPQTIAQLLEQTDAVVVGKLSNVKTWSDDVVDYGEGTIVVSEVLHGATPQTREVTLRWSNKSYTTGRLEFEDTGKTEYVWMLWRARDGSYRAHHSARQAPLKKKAEIIAGIAAKKKAQASTPATGRKAE
jgi:hypothetical protein